MFFPARRMVRRRALVTGVVVGAAVAGRRGRRGYGDSYNDYSDDDDSDDEPKQQQPQQRQPQPVPVAAPPPPQYGYYPPPGAPAAYYAPPPGYGPPPPGYPPAGYPPQAATAQPVHAQPAPQQQQQQPPQPVMLSAQVTPAPAAVAAAAGVTVTVVEGSGVEQSLPSIELDEAQVDALLKPNAYWPDPAEHNGMVIFHHAMLKDLDEMQQAAKRTLEQLEGGTPLEKWQVKYWTEYFAEFRRMLKAHHRNQEKGYFQWVETRVKLPDRLWADHKAITALSVKIDTALNGLEAGAEGLGKSLELFKGTVVQGLDSLTAITKDHFEEEETVALPLVRNFFTAEEEAAMQQAIVSTKPNPYDVAYVARIGETEDEKRQILTWLKVPAAVMETASDTIREYDRKFINKIRDLQSY